MKNQGNRRGGLILMGFGAFAILLMSLFAFIAINKIKDKIDLSIFITPFIMIGIMMLFPIVFGLITFLKGNKYIKVKKNGRKSICEVYNVMRVKSGYSLVVSYRSDTGIEYKHMLYISYQTAMLLRPGMKIECYILGEDCYVDENNIVEVKDILSY